MYKRPHKYLNIAVAAIFAATLLFTAQVRTYAHSTSASLPTLRLNDLVAETHWTHTLDPSFVTDATSYAILNLVHVDLVKLLPSGSPAPGLATHWTVSKNHKVYTFFLNPKARFSNGDAVTAQDVKFSLTRNMAKATGGPVSILYDGHILGSTALNNGTTNSLSGVKVINAHTVRISLDLPIAFFLASLTYPTADVLDHKVVNASQKPNTYLTNTCSADVGAGPFMFVCLNKHAALDSFFPSGSTPTMNLVPNPYYFGTHPNYKIQIRAIPSSDVNYRQYKAGAIDVTGIPTADIAGQRKTAGFSTYPTSQVDYITLDASRAPFSDVHCRLAVAYAIDRATIANKILHGAEKAIYDVVPKGMLGYYAGKDNPHFSVSKAQSELAQCSGGIHNVTFVYPAGSSDVANEYAGITSMMATAGIDAKAKEVPLNDWYNDVGQPLVKSNIFAVSNGWIEDYNDPQDYCESLLASYAPYDIGGYSNATYDSLMKQADVQANVKKRTALYVKAQHLALSTGAWISIGQVYAFGLTNPRWHNLVGSVGYGFPVAKGDNWGSVFYK